MIRNKEFTPQERIVAVVQRLRSQGYRFTPQRKAIVQAVLENAGHPSVEEIYRQVWVNFPMISLATVYKTLDILRDLGEVVELPVGGRTHYDGNPRPHVHLICERCHTVMDWSEEVSFPVPEESIVASGFHPRQYYLEVRGLCLRCRTEDISSALPTAAAPVTDMPETALDD